MAAIKIEKCKTTVLAMSDYYLPGYKAGGAVRTLGNIIDRLGSEMLFKVVTRDRDLGDSNTYQEISPYCWRRIGNAEVFYASPRTFSLKKMRQIILTTKHDILYLNSFFSPEFTIKPLLLYRLRLVENIPILLAPRGEFSANALALKAVKKKVFIWLAKISGLYDDVIWQASSEYEADDIRRCFGKRANIRIAPDLLPRIDKVKVPTKQSKKIAGSLRIVSLSRIARIKNLDGALKILDGLRGNVHFNIYGPIEDRTYWHKCQSIIDNLPSNIIVRYHGEIPHEEVLPVLSKHELFFSPSLGENFGHVIAEALTAGCPVLISDKTPWRGLEQKGVGWDVPLEKVELFQKILQKCIDMNAEQYSLWEQKASNYGMQCSDNQFVIDQNRILFHETMKLKISS